MEVDEEGEEPAADDTAWADADDGDMAQSDAAEALSEVADVDVGASAGEAGAARASGRSVTVVAAAYSSQRKRRLDASAGLGVSEVAGVELDSDSDFEGYVALWGERAASVPQMVPQARASRPARWPRQGTPRLIGHRWHDWPETGGVALPSIAADGSGPLRLDGVKPPGWLPGAKPPPPKPGAAAPLAGKAQMPPLAALRVQPWTEADDQKIF
eukprot:1484414-Prymnesium_polylepis.1